MLRNASLGSQECPHLWTPLCRKPLIRTITSNPDPRRPINIFHTKRIMAVYHNRVHEFIWSATHSMWLYDIIDKTACWQCRNAGMILLVPFTVAIITLSDFNCFLLL